MNVFGRKTFLIVLSIGHVQNERLRPDRFYLKTVLKLSETLIKPPKTFMERSGKLDA
jgi:hypothetical protein